MAQDTSRFSLGPDSLEPLGLGSIIGPAHDDVKGAGGLKADFYNDVRESRLQAGFFDDVKGMDIKMAFR